MRIGVLALQGAFIEHVHMLDRLGVQSKEIRQRADFAEELDGLIIPGGESTVIGKLLKELELLDPIREAIQAGLPVFGTCAGMIVLSRRVADSDTAYLGTMDTVVQRNAYGRQLGSFQTESRFAEIGIVPMVFIRAPYIIDAGDDVELLAKVDGKTVAARQDNMLVTSFHPELTNNPKVHEYFLSMVRAG